MKNKAWLAGLILVLALSACSMPTQAVETPTEEETAVAHSTEEVATETEMATEAPAATEAPESPLPIVYGAGEELVVLDPATGAEINRIAAPGFGGWGHLSILAMEIAFMAVVIWGVFRLAPFLANILGRTGINVLTRIMGLILAAIAVEFMANGLRQLLPGLAG